MFARSALQEQEADARIFLLHAATALEHLAKAVLVRRHPSFIVRTNDFESLLLACGDSVTNQPRSKMRTITAGEALERGARFVPTLRSLSRELEVLIAVRNGVAHLGHASKTDASDALIPYLKASEALRASTATDQRSYWGDFAPLVASALQANVEQTLLTVERALVIARQEFDNASVGSTQQRGRRC